MRTDRSVAPRRARPILGEPTYVAPRYHSSIWGRLIFSLLILSLCGSVGLVAYGLWALHRPQSSSNARVPVHVRTGASVTSVADQLHRRHLIDNPLLFRIDARLQGLSAKLKIGDYFVRRNMSIDQMVTALTQYHIKLKSVTVREGWRVEQISSWLQRNGIDARSFLIEARRPTLSDPILRDKPRSGPGASLEGYLYPNTYDVPLHYSGRQFADLLVRQLSKVFTPSMRAQARAHGLSVHQALTLASIVEREARVPAERRIIAGVYWNRLRKHMLLNADPTIQYAVGTSQNWWPILTLQQLRVQSLYNTYIEYGLPPGPIANAGLESIKAAVDPARTPFLYFVAKGNGHHAFARTYQEQLANQQKYQH